MSGYSIFGELNRSDSLIRYHQRILESKSTNTSLLLLSLKTRCCSKFTPRIRETISKPQFSSPTQEDSVAHHHTVQCHPITPTILSLKVGLIVAPWMINCHWHCFFSVHNGTGWLPVDFFDEVLESVRSSQTNTPQEGIEINIAPYQSLGRKRAASQQ